jgi:hypothetical protein
MRPSKWPVFKCPSLADFDCPLTDTAPTVLDLLGAKTPEAYQGVSLIETQPRLALFCADDSLGWLGLRVSD